MSPHWLEVMPAIPLARAVPIVRFRGARDSGVVLQVQPGLGVRVQFFDGDAFSGWGDPTHVRVDLDDPQGFGYALRWLGAQPNCSAARWAWVVRCMRRMCSHKAACAITDADRLALARALAEVAA